MHRHASTPRAALTALLMLTLAAGSLAPAARAQERKRKPVVVSFGQPNIWSLEQAHYLLARMHMTNLDLQAKTLDGDDLDPNRINATRIEVLKQLLDIGASFDQVAGFKNERAVETARFNDSRRRSLVANRDRLRAESLQLTLDINQLRRERADAEAGSDRAKQLDAQITQKEADKAAIDSAVSVHGSEITGLGSEPSTEVSTPTPAPPPPRARRPRASRRAPSTG